MNSDAAWTAPFGELDIWAMVWSRSISLARTSNPRATRSVFAILSGKTEEEERGFCTACERAAGDLYS